ncbi:hypothetical protein BDZ97DRAFT_1762295 [Flammula alnicola]|nr:hypothetical protein BDZ97DRAFT_1762295 [Flammula alnicola]
MELSERTDREAGAPLCRQRNSASRGKEGNGPSLAREFVRRKEIEEPYSPSSLVDKSSCVRSLFTFFFCGSDHTADFINYRTTSKDSARDFKTIPGVEGSRDPDDEIDESRVGICSIAAGGQYDGLERVGLANELRAVGIKTDFLAKPKPKLLAQRDEVPFAVIFGADELSAGMVTIKQQQWEIVDGKMVTGEGRKCG